MKVHYIFKNLAKHYAFHIILTLLFFYNHCPIYASWDSSLLSYLTSIKEDKLENHPMLSLWYGYSNFDNNLILLNTGKENVFAPLFNIGVQYGFKRYRIDKKLDNLYLISGENAFLENISSHLKPKSFKFDGYTIDGWRFGFSTNNGFGITLSQNHNIEFTSQSSFVWYRFDFEQYPEEVMPLNTISSLDSKYKFGSEFTGEISSNLNNFFHFTISQQNSLIYRDFNFSIWLPSYIIDLILQKWSDPLDDYFMEQIGKSYFIYKFIYKTGLSFLMYKIKKEHSFAPFNSEKSISFWSINLKLSFVNSK